MTCIQCGQTKEFGVWFDDICSTCYDKNQKAGLEHKTVVKELKDKCQ